MEAKTMKCIYTDSNGRRCNAYALKGKEFCFTHEPSIEHARRIARSKGGLRKRVYDVLPETTLKTPQEIQSHLEEITNLVRTNEISDKKAQLLQKLSDSLLRSVELGDLAERLEGLEDQIN